MTALPKLGDEERVRALGRHVQETAGDEHARDAADDAWRSCPLFGCVAVRDVLKEAA